METFARHVIPKNKPKLVSETSEKDEKEKFNILDVEKVNVRRKEDDLVSEEELGINKLAAGRAKRNDKGELVIEVHEDELINEPVEERRRNQEIRTRKEKRGFMQVEDNQRDEIDSINLHNENEVTQFLQ